MGILISKRAQVAAEAAIFLFMLAVCSAFLVVVVDSFHLYLQRLLGLASVQVAWQMSLVIGALAVLPFSLQRRLGHLGLLATLGVGMVMFIVAMIIYKYCTWDHALPFPPPKALPSSATDLLAMTSSIAFAFQCHIQCPRIFREMKQDAPQQVWWTVVLTAYGMCAGMYIVAGVLGYLIFGDGVKANVEEDFGEVVRVVVGLQSLVGYVINHFPAREAIYELQHIAKRGLRCSRGSQANPNLHENLLFRCCPDPEASTGGSLLIESISETRACGTAESVAPREEDGRIPRVPGYVLAILINVLTACLALGVRNLAFVTSITGGPVGSLVMLFFPAACAWMLPKYMKRPDLLRYYRLGSLCMVFMGLVLFGSFIFQFASGGGT